MAGPLDNSRYVNPWDRSDLRDLAGGLNTAQSPLLIRDNESPDCLNVDFDGGSVRSARGVVKLNNQTAQRPGLLVGQRIEAASIPVLPNKSAPMMSALYIPYSERQDIGARRKAADTGLAAPEDTTWAAQRGRSFEVRASFRIPDGTKLMRRGTLGSRTAPASADWTATLAGEELDEFIAILQKGGDRTAPMSWAIGLVNVGNIPEIDAGGGLNTMGISVAQLRERKSDYALCFMWLDAPQYGIDRPVRARYSLSGAKVWSDETTHVDSSFGSYPTLAYRAVIAPLFVVPGENYHFAVKVSLDTGTAGDGAEPTPAWNGDGWMEIVACSDRGEVETFRYDASSPTDATILRWKGPLDSLEYLTKYGIRWWGRDAMFVGLNQRFAPWSSAGFIPFGIDGAPIENGGFSLTDMSMHGPPTTLYGELLRPEEEPGGANVISGATQYKLRLAHNAGSDATGTLWEVSQRGLVRDTGMTGLVWGDETTAWANVAVQGRSPWGPLNTEWGGLGGLTASPNSGFNPEALRGYRLVLGATVAGGYSASGAAGQLISIGSYVLASPYGGATYTQHIVSEFKAFTGNPTFTGVNYEAFVRAFRWHQIPIVVSGIQILDKPYAVEAYELRHDLDSGTLARVGVLGHWPLDDGGEAWARETIEGNDGYMLPLGAAKTRAGGLFLSGEGEALVLDLRDNPVLLSQVKAALADPSGGVAIQMTVRLGEAFYGLRERVKDHTGAFAILPSPVYRNAHRFAPTLATWSHRAPERSVKRDITGASLSTLSESTAAGGHFTPVKPILEFGHSGEFEVGVDGRASRQPMGFNLRLPTVPDHQDFDAKVPGSGATGLHAWWLSAAPVSRWDIEAGWVGRQITLQFGFEPTATPGTFRTYIALNDGSESAIWSDIQLDARDAERAIITIGGTWGTRVREAYDAVNGMRTRGFSLWESCARMIVDAVTVYGGPAPGLLPAASGGRSIPGMGKTTSAESVRGAPTSAVLERAAGGGSARVRAGEWAIYPGDAGFQASAERTYLRIGDSLVELPKIDDLPDRVPDVYYASSRGQFGRLTLSRPYRGASQDGVRLVASRAIAATAFADSLEEFNVGAGLGFNISLTEAGDAMITAPLFTSIVDLGVHFRMRVHSNLGRGSSVGWRPQPVRGALLGHQNRIAGIFGFDGRIFAGARGSLFEVDDRWRFDDDETPSLAFRADGDRAVTSDFFRLESVPVPADGMAWVFEFEVKPDADGDYCVAWSGDPLYAGRTTFSTGIYGGRPRLSIHSADTVGGLPVNDNRFTAEGASSIRPGRWSHIRWAIVVDGASFCRPYLWIDGIPVETEVDAVADLATGPRAWLSPALVLFRDILWADLVLGAELRPDRSDAQPTVPNVSNASALPLQPNISLGWRNQFLGELRGVAVWSCSSAEPEVAPGVAFPPGTTRAEAYIIGIGGGERSGEFFGWFVEGQARIADAVIESRPFISLSHAMGSSEEPFTFAAEDRRIYVANGGRIGLIDVT